MLSRKELRSAIKVKIDQAQVRFSETVILCMNSLERQITELEKAGHRATADNFRCRYMDFVEDYHMFCGRVVMPGFFATTRELQNTNAQWAAYLAYLADQPVVFTGLASPKREISLRETYALLQARLDESNMQINSIVEEHLSSIRNDAPTTLNAIALIPTISMLKKLSRGMTDFENLEKAITELEDIVHRAELIHLSLAQQFVK